MKKSVLFLLFLAFVTYLYLVAYTDGRNLITTHIPDNISKPTHTITYICLSGIHGQAKDTYLPFRETASGLGYEVITIERDYRDVSVKKPIESVDSRLRGRTIHNDTMDLVKKVKAALKKVPANAQVYLVGHSYGGLLAPEIYRIISEQRSFGVGVREIDGLILLCPVLSAEYDYLTWDVKFDFLYLYSDYGLGFDEKIVGRRKKSFIKVALPAQMPEKRADAFYEKLVYESGKVLKELAGNRPTIDYSVLPSKILIVGAENDRLIPSGILFDYSRKMKADFILLPDTAHYLFLTPYGINKNAIVKILQWTNWRSRD